MLNRWLEIGKKVSFRNENMLKVLFVVLLSQYFKEYQLKTFDSERSPRLSTFIVSPTRSGKGQSTDITIKAAKKLGLSVAIETKITDAGLFGSIDYEAIKHNAKEKADEDSKKWINPIIYGDLYDKDLIVFKEAKQMVKQGNYNEDILEILQEATDNSGELRKKLSSQYEIHYCSSSSIIATTYYIEKLKQVLLQQGIFQRFLVVVQELDYEGRRQLNDQIHDNMGISVNVEEELDVFCEQLKKIKKARIETVYIVTPEAVAESRSIIREYEIYIKSKFQGKEVELLMPFTTSGIEKLSKIALLFAIIDPKNQKPLITKEHIRQAQRILHIDFKSVFNELTMHVNVNTVMKETHKNIIMYLKRNPGTPKEKLYEEMKIFEANRNKLVKTVFEMISQNLLRVERKKTDKSFRPLELVFVND